MGHAKKRPPRPARDPLLIVLATIGALGGLIGGMHGLGWF